MNTHVGHLLPPPYHRLGLKIHFLIIFSIIGPVVKRLYDERSRSSCHASDNARSQRCFEKNLSSITVSTKSVIPLDRVSKIGSVLDWCSKNLHFVYSLYRKYMVNVKIVMEKCPVKDLEFSRRLTYYI